MSCCENCVFFKNANDYGMGVCCRFPPVPVSIVESTGNIIKTDVCTRYPEVQSNFWCGEHVDA